MCIIQVYAPRLGIVYKLSCAISHHMCTPNSLAHVHAPTNDADAVDKEEG